MQLEGVWSTDDLTAAVQPCFTGGFRGNAPSA